MSRIKIIIASFFFLVLGFPALAQTGGQTLTITPPLIKNNVNPGQVWKSYVKVVNNNATAVKVYHELKDFRGGTESGTVDFLEGDKKNLDYLSNWIKIDEDFVDLKPYESVEIPFIVVVPEDASPGGHYTAILLGTKPSDDDEGGSVMKVSSMLASLILLNVSGDIEESGRIREFSTNKTVYSEPKVVFDVRFENTGNVHLQPQGEIRIYDWFGNDKGAIKINQGTEFGNVLPKTIRKWNYTWEGSNNLLEMGRYKASLILGFGGESGRQTIDQQRYFWVINVKLILFTVLPIILFIALIFFLIRTYIKRAVKRARKELGLVEDNKDHTHTDEDTEPTIEKERVWPKFLLGVFFVMCFVAIVFFVVFYVNSKNNEFSDKYEKNNKETLTPKPINLEAIIPDKNKGLEKETTTTQAPVAVDKEVKKEGSTDKGENGVKEHSGLFTVDVLNGSGRAGVARSVAKMLEDDYIIGRVDNADAYEYTYTFIKYKKGLKDEAEKIKEFFTDDTEIEEDDEMNGDIVVIVGKEYEVQ